MAIGTYFRPAAMSKQKYEEVLGLLEAAGSGNPPGRLYHVSFGSDDALQVFDIWDSQENFEAFGQVLMPILERSGINPGEPMIEPVHKVIPGK